MSIGIHELERAIKYRQREIESFRNKLQLLIEQKEQYENDLIPKYEKEIEEIQECIERLRFEGAADDDLPF